MDYGRDLKSWDNLRRIWEGEKGWKENWHALLAVYNWLQRIIWNRPWVRNSLADRLWFWALIQFHQYFAFKLSCQEFKGTLFWCRYSSAFFDVEPKAKSSTSDSLDMRYVLPFLMQVFFSFCNIVILYMYWTRILPNWKLKNWFSWYEMDVYSPWFHWRQYLHMHRLLGTEPGRWSR